VIASVVAVTTSFTGPPVGMAGVSATMPTKDLAHSFGNNKPTASEPKERSERAPRGEKTPRAPRPAQVATPAPVAAPAIEVIAKPMPELPKVAFQALEETPLHSVVQSAGMIWVATDSSKHAEAQSQIKAEPVASNLGRAPKPAASLPDGPMVLVETGGQEKAV
jgi:ribonuclease E